MSSLPLLARARVLWWRLGLTPTARLRAARFRQALRDRRGYPESFRMARRAAAY